MDKKLLSLIILLFGIFSTLSAQEDNRITIKGVVVDATTGEPIPFANLGVLGTVAGVASDMDGNFELLLPLSLEKYKVRVSVVGYTSYEMNVEDVKGEENMRIALKPVTYGIGEVDVYAESLVYKKMIRQVVENIGKNYLSKPYNYEGYFEYMTSEEDQPARTKEAIVEIYDRTGYKRSDVQTAFKDLNYRFREVRRSEDTGKVSDGLNYFDDILTGDIIRNTRNVLDISNARDYKLKNKGRILYEGDSVQVIAYEVSEPALSTSGDASVTSYSGEIYIHLKDLAVLKNVTYISAKDFNILGRNLVAIDSPKQENVKMTIITNYKKLNSAYFLSGITIQYTYKEGEKNKNGRMQYVTTRLNATNPEVFQGRMYYEDIETNRDFWENYTVYFQED